MVSAAADLRDALRCGRSGCECAKARGNVHCPAHDDGSPSLSIDDGNDGQPVIYCHAGCQQSDVLSALRERGLWKPDPRNGTQRSAEIVAKYDYVDEAGVVLFQVVRYMPKTFKQRRPNGRGGWTWDLKSTRRVLYRLPTVIEAARHGGPIYVVEGEKDVHAIEGAGGVATCNSGGAGKWRPEYGEALSGAEVVIVADRDEPGRKHAAEVVASLRGIAASVRIVEAAEGKDAADHLAAGHSLDDFVAARVAAAEPGTTEEPMSPARREMNMQDNVGTVFAPAAPMRNAELFARARYPHPQRSLLINQGNTFFNWNGTSWPEVEDASLRSNLYEFFRDAEYTAGEDVKPFDPTRHKVLDLLDALAAVAHLPTSVTVPAWLDGAGPVPAREIVACTNGLVHVPTRTLHPLTPTFYAHHATPFSYDERAPAPTRWLGFLGELWPDDRESVEVLQEVFGYLVSGDSSLQKIFLLVGPKRSGKGTIARVLTAMIGRHHVAGPTLAGLGTNFGLQPLIGKAVAIVADARIRNNESVITERLLSISGEDTITIDRKYRDPWTGQLSSRFVILSNELPRLTDSSGALASRFVMLTMTRSFYGKENPKLTDDLIAELPGIFNWALDGLERLRVRGHFVQPQSSADALRELEDLGSPVSAFVRECCEIGAGRSVAVDDMYSEWRRWCTAHGRDHPGTAQTFGRDLRAALPGIRTVQPRDGGSRQRRYEGVCCVE